jgi:hypothetical protein
MPKSPMEVAQPVSAYPKINHFHFKTTGDGYLIDAQLMIKFRLRACMTIALEVFRLSVYQ